MALRFSLFAIAAIVLNLLLFYFIQQMVNNDPASIDTYEDLRLIEFVRLREEPPEPEEQRKEEEPPDKPEPEEPEEPPPEISQPEPPEPQQTRPDVPSPNIDIPLGIDGVPYVGDFMKSPEPEPETQPDTSSILTDVKPTVRIPPQYPPRALRSGIEGSVTVEFTIATDGSVKDPKIVDADPPHIFNDTVLRAIQRWEFNPEKVDGQIVERRARQVVRFKLQ